MTMNENDCVEEGSNASKKLGMTVTLVKWLLISLPTLSLSLTVPLFISFSLTLLLPHSLWTKFGEHSGIAYTLKVTLGHRLINLHQDPIKLMGLTILSLCQNPSPDMS